MKLGEFINSYLNEHDMSMRQFGEKCGLSHQTISYIINDRLPSGKSPNITFNTAKRIANAMGLDVDDLASDVDFNFAWGKTRNKNTLLTSEEETLLEAWNRASKDDKFAVYAILRKYGMTQPLGENTTVSSAS